MTSPATLDASAGGRGNGPTISHEIDDEVTPVVVLRERLQNRTRDLCGEVRTGDSIDGRALRSLLELERLIGLRERIAGKQPGRRKWLVIVILCLTIIILAFLGTTSKAALRVHMTVSSDTAQLRLGRPQQILGGLQLRDVLVADLADVRDESEDQSIETPSVRVTVRDGQSTKFIGSGSVGLDRDAKVEISGKGPRGPVRLTLGQERPLRWQLSVNGGDSVTLGRDQDGKLGPQLQPVPSALTLSAGKQMDILLWQAGEGDCVICVPLPISAIRFDTAAIEEHDMKLEDRWQSSVRSAEIKFDDIPGKTISLGARELLLVELDEATARTVAVSPSGRMALELDGVVRKLETGSTARPYDLRPSRLTWLLAQGDAVAIWTGAIYLCGILLAAFRWWGLKV